MERLMSSDVSVDTCSCAKAAPSITRPGFEMAHRRIWKRFWLLVGAGHLAVLGAGILGSQSPEVGQLARTAEWADYLPGPVASALSIGLVVAFAVHARTWQITGAPERQAEDRLARLQFYETALLSPG
jgi:hypothetical protein